MFNKTKSPAPSPQPRADNGSSIPPLPDLPMPGGSAAAPARAGLEFTEALSGLRQELKQDIAESLSREIAGLRNEMRSIRALAEEVAHEMQELAESLGPLGPGADGRAELRQSALSAWVSLLASRSKRQMLPFWSPA